MRQYIMRYALLFILGGLLSYSTTGQAQAVEPDSAFLGNAVQYATSQYERAMGGNESLFDGYEYIGYDPRLKIHPYFEADNWQAGTIQYKGKTFASIPLLYDLVKDVIVVDHKAGFRMVLQSDKVESFSFLNHTFVHVADSTNRGLRTGFYDLLYNGPTQLLVRRVKTIRINTTASYGYGMFEPHATYYIRKNGQYYPVKNKKNVLSLLSDQKKELSAFARKEKLRFRPDPEAAILKLTQHYDEVNK